MRKLSKTRFERVGGPAPELPEEGGRPNGIQGATVTSWSGMAKIDLSAILCRPLDGVTVSGSIDNKTKDNRKNMPAVADATTVSLSDGTRITFSSAGQFTVAELS